MAKNHTRIALPRRDNATEMNDIEVNLIAYSIHPSYHDIKLKGMHKDYSEY